MSKCISRPQTSRVPGLLGRMAGVGLATLLGSVGCNTATSTEMPVEMMVQLVGTVTSDASGMPIGGAVIEIFATSTNQVFGADTTDTAGEYAIAFRYVFFLSDPQSSFCPFLGFVEAPGFRIETISPACTGNEEIYDVQLAVD